MLNNKGFDLWADGYDKTVGISDEENIYPFAGYKKVLGFIFQTIMRDENAVVLDIGCLLYTSPSPRDRTRSRMPSSA